MNILIIFIVIAIASLTPLAIKQEKTVRTSASAFATVTALLVLWTVWPQLFGRAAVVTSWWLIDGFSAMMASLVAILFFAVALVSHRYIGHERHEGIISDTEVRVYYSLLNLFVLSMLLTVMTNNTLVLWLALESTTLSSTFLVGLYRKKTSIEAAWKYVIICSTGITLGLIGILLLGYGTNSIGNHTSIFLLSSLTANAALLPVKLVKLAFVFLFIGFGAKVGFVPTHTWLPDAHSNAPSPISALFSGILLNVALYAIIRFQLITDRALGSHTWTSTFYLIFGSMSVLLPASLLLIQRNYKRMLAYSSIEHMGLIAFGLAVPPIGTIAAVMHMAGHTLVKSSLFFGAGEILLRHKTTH
ncbi:hydrogenase 4 subunit F, partial [Candidatus Falkowbacteria bacterium]|nr:hydrogenase 4 subunit F [Candidatus Falkowbacteria bacterium]